MSKTSDCRITKSTQTKQYFHNKTSYAGGTNLFLIGLHHEICALRWPLPGNGCPVDCPSGCLSGCSENLRWSQPLFGRETKPWNRTQFAKCCAHAHTHTVSVRSARVFACAEVRDSSYGREENWRVVCYKLLQTTFVAWVAILCRDLEGP